MKPVCLNKKKKHKIFPEQRYKNVTKTLQIKTFGLSSSHF